MGFFGGQILVQGFLGVLIFAPIRSSLSHKIRSTQLGYWNRLVFHKCQNQYQKISIPIAFPFFDSHMGKKVGDGIRGPEALQVRICHQRLCVAY